MKPHVIFIKVTPKDGKVTMTENEFKKYLEKAYEDGYNDGKQYTPYWYGGYTYNTTAGNTTNIPYQPNKYEVTCSSDTSSTTVKPSTTTTTTTGNVDLSGVLNTMLGWKK